MDNIIELKDLNVKLSRDEVLRLMDCYEDSPIYEEVLEEYEEIKEEMLNMCRASVLFKFAQADERLLSKNLLSGTEVVYALYSIGGGISAYSTQCFASGDYLKGMLSDAMADSLLFSLENEVRETLREECSRRHFGIARRLEAPRDMPMEAQKVIHEETEAKKLLGIDISSGHMFDPVKSNGVVFILTEDETVFKSQHDCRTCNRLDCKMRNVPDIEITVKEKEKSYQVYLKENESILDGLMAHGVYFSAVCGGKGSCGKCRIRVIWGTAEITDSDRKLFSEEELQKGWRLACRAYPKEPVTIETSFNDESDFEILGDYQKEDVAKEGSDEDRNYVIAIDIGTTTLAFQMLEKATKKAIHTYTTVNRQRAFGADVISRIKASSEGKKEELQRSIRQDLIHGIHSLTESSGIQKGKIREIAIGANTTMVHLLMGYDCETLGVYPFTPVNIELIKNGYSELLADDYLDVPVFILPGISTFVGGDIAAGLLECGFDEAEKVAVLIDLGTNGEMAIGNKEKILVTSTAAGPAFEGGNIQWGMGSVAGAISGVSLAGDQVSIKTIGDKEPVGICGTGVLEIVAELVKEEIVDDSGLLDEEYFEDGYPLAQTKAGESILFTQKDVREIQLAKAAVRAGLETLILRYGVAKKDIGNVYLAGGFGFKLDIGKAIAIGMIPEEFSDRIKTVGNSSLGGAVQFLTDSDGKKRIKSIRDAAAEINLSSDKDFNNLYMDSMFFEED